MKVQRTEDVYSYESIEKFTSKLRNNIKSEYNLRDSQNDEILSKIVSHYNGKIERFSDFELWIQAQGSLIVNADYSFTIELSTNESHFDNNFTIAHEIGHYFLHTNFGEEGEDQIEFRRYGRNIFEVQANRFAASLLMPKDLILQKKEKLWANVIIANFFRVNVNDVETRLSYLIS